MIRQGLSRKIFTEPFEEQDWWVPKWQQPLYRLKAFLCLKRNRPKDTDLYNDSISLIIIEGGQRNTWEGIEYWWKELRVGRPLWENFWTCENKDGAP